MKLRKLFYLLLVLPMLFVYTGCSKDENPAEPTPAINEAQVLVEYLEANGNYLNTANPAIITADDVRALQLSNPSKLYIIDVRSAADFTGKGYIQGAVNVTLGNLVTHIKGINTTSYDRIVITCYTGQTSGYATALLRLLGYSNVYSLKFGMCSWNSQVATNWTSNIGNNYTNLVTTSYPKAAAGSLPTLSTGKTTGKDILEARITALLSTTNPFGDATVAWNTLTGNLSNYYIVNYWPANHYALGHLTGAIQYTPKADLALATSLKTLPTNKTVVIYCYTGQTSASTAAILRVMGYDAKSMNFGTNTLSYDWAVTNNLVPWKQSECKEYPFVK
ncbi:MAG: rhodanese-like domain-containing protein [Melioribacteraceae bacterium]|nr:rhodanese-like domain-containing protein [Melioribacteraceae bacterium]